MDPTDIPSKTTFTRTELFDMLNKNGRKFSSFEYCQEQMNNLEQDTSYYYELMSTRFNNQKRYDIRYSRIEKICQVGGLLIGQNITLTLKGFMGYRKNVKGKIESVDQTNQTITLGRRKYTNFESVSFNKSLDDMDKLLIEELTKLITKLDSSKILILIDRVIVLLVVLLKSVPSEYKKIKDSLTALLNDKTRLHSQYESLDSLMNYPNIFSEKPLKQLIAIRNSITGIKAKFSEETPFTAIFDTFSEGLTDIETKMKALIEKHKTPGTYGMPGGRLSTRKNTKKNRKIRRNKTSSKIN
jgi:hypothetical protein